MTEFQTKEFYERYDAEAEREHGGDHDLETYQTEPDILGQEYSIGLTTKEREDFEAETGIDLQADLVTHEVFSQLLNWAKSENLVHED